MALDEIFSEETMLGYSRACLELGEDIPVRWKEKKFDTLIIPSRGAVPFFLGALYALDKLKDWTSEHEQFYEWLGVQPILAPLLPKDSVQTHVRESNIRVLLVPFTADLNINRFDANEDNTKYTKATREYWAAVTASFFKSEEERRKDPYFASFVDVVLRRIEGREHIAEMYKSFPQISRFALIDTVISGRASNEILKAFKDLALKRQNERLRPDAFLIVDNNGKKLKPIFAHFLLTEEGFERAKLYKIPRIVSEDEGASLLGVGAVVYPSIMRASKSLRIRGEIGHNDFFVGAGSWRLGSELGNDNHLKDFGKFMELVYNGIDIEFEKKYGNGPSNEKHEKFNAKRMEFVEYATNIDILNYGGFDQQHILKSMDYFASIMNPYITGSFVLHVPLGKIATDEILEKLSNLNGVSRKPAHKAKIARTH